MRLERAMTAGHATGPTGTPRGERSAGVDRELADPLGNLLAGTVLFQALFSALSLYLRFSDQLLALRAFGGLALLLVWLYLLTNILILGAEINWWHWSRRWRRACRYRSYLVVCRSACRRQD